MRSRHPSDGIGVVFGASLVEQPGVSKLLGNLAEAETLSRLQSGCARHGLPLGEGSGAGTRAVDRDDPKADRGTP